MNDERGIMKGFTALVILNSDAVPALRVRYPEASRIPAPVRGTALKSTTRKKQISSPVGHEPVPKPLKFKEWSYEN